MITCKLLALFIQFNKPPSPQKLGQSLYFKVQKNTKERIKPQKLSEKEFNGSLNDQKKHHSSPVPEPPR